MAVHPNILAWVAKGPKRARVWRRLEEELQKGKTYEAAWRAVMRDDELREYSRMHKTEIEENMRAHRRRQGAARAAAARRTNYGWRRTEQPGVIQVGIAERIFQDFIQQATEATPTDYTMQRVHIEYTNPTTQTREEADVVIPLPNELTDYRQAQMIAAAIAAHDDRLDSDDAQALFVSIMEGTTTVERVNWEPVPEEED